MSSKRKKVAEASQPSQQPEPPKPKWVLDPRTEEKIGPALRRFFPIKKINSEDFTRQTCKETIWLKHLPPPQTLQTPEKECNLSTPRRSKSMRSALSSPSTTMRGKITFIHMNRLEIYPKNEIKLGRAYLLGQQEYPSAVYGYIHDIIVECRLNGEELLVQDLYFRVKLLEQVRRKQYEAHKQQNAEQDQEDMDQGPFHKGMIKEEEEASQEEYHSPVRKAANRRKKQRSQKKSKQRVIEDEEDQEEQKEELEDEGSEVPEELRTPPHTSMEEEQEEEEGPEFDKDGNLLKFLKNTEQIVDISYKELQAREDTLFALRLHGTLEGMQKHMKKKSKAVEHNCVLLEPSQKDIKKVVRQTMNKMLATLEMNLQLEEIKSQMNLEKMDLVAYGQKIWNEGGFKRRKKVKMKRKKRGGSVGVENFTVEEIELEYDESSGGQEEKEYETWSGGSENQAELEDQKPVDDFNYEADRKDKKDEEYLQMFNLKEKKKMIQIEGNQESEDQKEPQHKLRKTRVNQKQRKELILKSQENYNKAISVSLLNFVPAEINCRDLETVQIKNFLEGSLNSNVKGSLYISGMPGTGKTALVLRCIRQIKKREKFKFLSINAMNLSKPVMLYKILYEQILKDKKKIRGEEASAALEKYFHDEPLINRSGEHIILLLDELDAIVNKKQDVLYNLFNWPTYDNSGFAVIAIANTMDLPEQFQPKIASRIGKLRVVFEPYSKEQMFQILESRVGKYELFEKDALRFLATRVAQQSGDFRRVLHTARQALEMARSQFREKAEATTGEALDVVRVRVKTVLQAYNFLYGVKLHRSLKEISPIQKIILVALMWAGREKIQKQYGKNKAPVYFEDSAQKIDLNVLIGQIQSVVNDVNTKCKSLIPTDAQLMELVDAWYHKTIEQSKELEEGLETLALVESKRILESMGFLFDSDLVDSVLLTRLSLMKELQQMERRRFVKVTESPKFFDVELQVFKSELLTALQHDTIFKYFGEKIGAEEN